MTLGLEEAVLTTGSGAMRFDPETNIRFTMWRHHAARPGRRGVNAKTLSCSCQAYSHGIQCICVHVVREVVLVREEPAVIIQEQNVELMLK